MEQAVNCGQTIEYEQIEKSLYDRLKFLGIIPDEIRRYNIGNSNYSQHTIQPWSIWLDYDLNAWDADIIKRILRTKAEPGLSEVESRIMDYDKIIHICEERKRQLQSNESSHYKSNAVIAKTFDDKEIVHYLLGNELTKYQNFLSKHKSCGGLIQTTIKETEKGTIIIVSCPICGQCENITDTFMWS